ncbi:cytochrome b [Zooshikella harenae]|uniref:Cytochrome b n=1 Tax=Zooshikella harenae TaxID=2827238 RepID=A0ABS5Z9R4_9GAMM|nr:cytochrome b [Zooshikella harenae]MBU2709632.1 cytochrome b [Zooshikella harenae]
MRDTKEKLTLTTVVLHWVVAFGMISLIILGIYMTENHAYTLYPIHKSFGVILLFIVLFRTVWRFVNKLPKPVRQYTSLELLLSKIVHYSLIIGTLLIPISGIAMSTFSGHGVQLFNFVLIESNINPTEPGKVIALNTFLAETASFIHVISNYIVMFCISLHILAALKHHFYDGDTVLKRMLGQRI